MFRRQLRRNIRLKLRSLGLAWPVEDAVGVFTVHVPGAERDRPLQPVLAALRQVFGIVWLTCARRLRPLRFTAQSAGSDFVELEQHVAEMAERQYVEGQQFSVRVNRGNKLLPFASLELAARLGQSIRDRTRWRRVNLKHPDVTFRLDLRCAATYLFGEKLKGPGGLPVGTSGRVLTLLSGGIDSPVAAYLMAKRGCLVDFIHFTPTTTGRDEVLQSKIWRLAAQLSKFTLRSRLLVLPYVHFDLALTRQRIGFELVLFRRFMARVAERVARQWRAKALVTGDNLSQVASQTMSNLASASRVTDLMVLRPIVAFDKEETISLAQKIGTYDISIEPYKDCCALISRHPKTRSVHERLQHLEALAFPDYERLIEHTLADAICLECGTAGTGRREPIFVPNAARDRETV